MGDPIGKRNGMPGQLPSGQTPRSASNRGNGTSSNGTATWVESRSATPRTDHAANSEEIDPRGTISFLRDFASLQEFGKQFPGLDLTVLPGRTDGNAAESFAVTLRTALGPERCEALTRKYSPADILRGLAELRARQEGRKPGQVASREKSETGTRPQERKRSDSRRRPRGGTLPHLVINREIGARPRHAGDDLQSRFSALRHDPVASLAVLANFDIDGLRHYEEGITGLLQGLKISQPERWDLISEQLSRSRCTETPMLREATSYVDCVVLSLGVPLSLDRGAMAFFRELSCMEFTLRFLREISVKKGGSGKDAEGRTDEKQHDEKRQHELLRSISEGVARDVLLGFLRIERARPGFDAGKGFREILVATLITLYETGDLCRSREAFRSAARVRWPKLSRQAAGDATASTPVAVDALRYVEKVIAFFPTGKGRFDEFPKDRATAVKDLVREISFYHYVTEAPKPPAAIQMALGLDLILTCTGLQEPGRPTG